MDEDRSHGPVRLRDAGVGVTAGGVVLAWGSLLLPPIGSAGVTLLASLVWLVIDPPYGSRSRVALGIAFVGVIALFEASPLGLGIDHLVLGFIAMALGLFDIVAGLTMARWRRRT